MPSNLTPHAAADLVHGSAEMALLDVREAGQFGEGHALFAVPVPYSRLELMVPALVPRRGTKVILVDDGDGVADRAHTALLGLGYCDVAIIDGGMPGWRLAGLGMFKGVNVPSKLLGELVQHRTHPRTITSQQLAAWRHDGRPYQLFDARPPAEYAKMRIPGAVCLPNGELAHRYHAVASGNTPIVVTCAGRTRGLIGVAGLRLAGIGGEIYALENGTQGWTLAGLALERANTPAPFPRLDDTALASSRQRGEALMRAQAIPSIDAASIAGWIADPDRTTYLFDVRSAPETSADPIPSAVAVPGVQLVQATDQWVGVRRSRIVLLDDTGLRAAIAAHWLRCLGYEAVIATVDDPIRRLPATPPVPMPPLPLPISPDACHRLLADDADAMLLDLSPSRAYRELHAEPAVWAIRPRLPDVRRRVVCLMADEPAIATLAAVNLAAQGANAIRWVEGGRKAWRAAGLPVASTPSIPSDAEAIDYLLFVHDRHDGNLDACRRYLAWEQGLLDQVSEDERHQFRVW